MNTVAALTPKPSRLARLLKPLTEALEWLWCALWWALGWGVGLAVKAYTLAKTSLQSGFDTGAKIDE